MNLLVLLLRMMRYRVAIMLIIFYTIAFTTHQSLFTVTIPYLMGVLALAFSYVAATTINDIADYQIDTINHPNNIGRPLVSGYATRKDLYLVHAIAVIFSVSCAAVISQNAVFVLLCSLAVNYIYSVAPVRFSYRTHFAPLLLSGAYVVIPYILGLITVHQQFTQHDIFLLAALVFLFFGRIILKDFRDRKGDAKFGKPTFLLRYGKRATIYLSSTAIISGNILLLFVLPIKNFFFMLCIMFFFVTMYYAQYMLFRSATFHREQVSIGIGAKMGNGLLLTILGILILQGYHAPLYQDLLFAFLLTLLFVLSFIVLIRNPESAVIGYKG